MCWFITSESAWVIGHAIVTIPQPHTPAQRERERERERDGGATLREGGGEEAGRQAREDSSVQSLHGPCSDSPRLGGCQWSLPWLTHLPRSLAHQHLSSLHLTSPHSRQGSDGWLGRWIPCKPLPPFVRVISPGVLKSECRSEVLALVQPKCGGLKVCILKRFALSLSHRDYFSRPKRWLAWFFKCFSWLLCRNLVILSCTIKIISLKTLWSLDYFCKARGIISMVFQEYFCSQ